jgi:AraC-like DNA-binding protein
MILYQLYQKCPHHMLNAKELSTKKEHSRRLNRMVQYIEDHYNQPIALLDLATLEGLSVTYVSHYLKDHLGISFQTYLNAIRFEHASFLLLNTDLSILNICIEVGISSSRYLNNMFQERFQTTALEFKKKSKLTENVLFNSLPLISPDTLEKHFQNFDTLKTLSKYRNEVSPTYTPLLSTFFL